MSLLVLSLRLSVHTFWRYLIAMVLCAICVLFVFKKAPVSVWVWFFLLAPVVALLIIFALASLLVVGVLGGAVFAGICSALHARGHMTLPTIGRFGRSTFVFGLLAVVVCFVAGVLGSGILFVASLAGGPGDAQALADGLRDGSPVAYIMLLLVLIPPALALSMSVVPLTAIVHAGEVLIVSPDFGFGKGLRLLAPMAMVILYAGAVTLVLGDHGGIVTALQPTTGLFLPLVWAAGWFFSLGVLIWEQITVQDRRTAADHIRATRIDPRRLRLARESANPDIV